MSKAQRGTSVTWATPELRKALSDYAEANMMQGGVPELIRHSVKAYIRQRKPKEGTDLYKALKLYLE
jgi:hypothetical protein